MTKNQRGLNDLHRQAGQGSVRAQRILGEKYLRGDGVPRDYRNAAKWLRRAAVHSDRHAENLMEQYLRHAAQHSGREDLKFLQAAAEEGVGEAQAVLAEKYLWGNGVQRDHQFAEELYQCAIRQCETDAVYHLNGVFIEECKRARAKAKAESQRILAEKNRSHMGVKRDDQSLKQLLNAAKRSENDAMSHLKKRDFQSAKIEKAKAVSADAMYQLERMYLDIEIPPKRRSAPKRIKKVPKKRQPNSNRKAAEKQKRPRRTNRKRNDRYPRNEYDLSPGSTGSAHT